MDMKKITTNQVPDMKAIDELSSKIIEMCKEQGENTDNVAVKLKICKDSHGEVMTEISPVLDYHDIEEMSLVELRVYYEKLELQLDELENNEPEEDSDEYEKWEDALSEIEEEMDSVEDRIDELIEENK